MPGCHDTVCECDLTLPGFSIARTDAATASAAYWIRKRREAGRTKSATNTDGSGDDAEEDHDGNNVNDDGDNSDIEKRQRDMKT